MLLSHEVRTARQLWNQSKRLSDPGEAAAIEAGRTVVDLGRMEIAVVGAVALRQLRTDRQSVLRILLASDSEPVRAGYAALDSAGQTRLKWNSLDPGIARWPAHADGDVCQPEGCPSLDC